MLKSYQCGGVGGCSPPRFLSQPQSPFGPIGVRTGLDWVEQNEQNELLRVGIGSRGIGD